MLRGAPGPSKFGNFGNLGILTLMYFLIENCKNLKRFRMLYVEEAYH